MSKKKSDSTFESEFERLSKIVGQLESEETTLDESLALYEEGVELSRFCVEKLTTAQERLKELKKKSDGIFELVELES
jgi:exodeoxyribonuclease VII small subunit